MKKSRACRINMKRIFNISTLILLCFFCFTKIADAAQSSSIVLNAKNGEVLSHSNADVPVYPASLTKVMTLYMVFDAVEKGWLSFDQELPVSRTAQNRSPSRLGLRAGKTIKLKDAVMGLVVKSANDAATVIAESLGGSEKEFAKMMTKVARELGMSRTTFKNASGLPNRAQTTTARDMAMLGMAMYHHFPQYYHLFSTKKFTYNGQTHYTHNKLLRKFDGADGLKTGYIAASGFNIITSATRKNERVITVVMGQKTAIKRDVKTAKLMEKHLSSLVMSPDNVPLPLIKPGMKIAKSEILDKDWAIQIGAFSNYAKARNYAIHIQNGLSEKIGIKEIQVLAHQSGPAIVYRSRLMGMEADIADTACDELKKQGKSCMVVAPVKSSTQIANR